MGCTRRHELVYAYALYTLHPSPFITLKHP
ncbi:Protein of unknown function [Pyronema omphalodes CBS 100304]|uniref:Uncharacterized protein n=1 Tax=Pyronema omphalodes (strain CBS 100304) TaxID=1076935 RepID=U4LNE6_PYROM|nr:Protein of unknown function [Pyronema omphalodes CBS 100304]